MDATHGISVMYEGEAERYFVLQESLTLTAVLDEQVEVDSDSKKLKAKISYYEPPLLSAWISTTKALCLVVESAKGRTMDPLNPHPLVRLEGMDIFEGKREVWETMWCDVVIQDSAGRIVA